MIRFLDKEVVSLQLESYDRDQVFRYFLNGRSGSRKEGTEMVLIYNGLEYIGLATYYSVLGRKGKNGILTGKYVMSQDEELFCGLHQAFQEASEEVEYIPVFRQDGQLLYFAYQYESISAKPIETYILPLLERSSQNILFKNIYPNIEKLCIYDMNELGFRFYKILKAQNFPVQVFGEKWLMLFPEIYEMDQIKLGDTLAERIMNIYAEGKDTWMHENGSGRPGYKMGVAESWGIILDIGEAVVLSEYDKIKKDLRKKGIAAWTMIFPDMRRLGFRTVDEFYRYKMSLSLGGTDLNEENPLVVQQIHKCWCQDGENKLKDAATVGDRLQNQSIVIGNESLNYKCYGRGEHTLYLLGPCIVAGSGVDGKDSFGQCVYREIEKTTGGGVYGEVLIHCKL